MGRTAGLRPAQTRRLERLSHRRHPESAGVDWISLQRLAAESAELDLPLSLVLDERGLCRLLWVDRSFALVRSVIRNRSLPYAGSESQCLRDPQLTAVIDEGCRLFHLGKTNKELYQQALALSAAQCLALQDQLGPALDQYLQGAGLELPETLIASVRASFIDAYRS